MSRSIPSALAAKLASERDFTFCRWIEITLQDGAVFGFTDHDRDLLIEGTLFEPAFALGLSAISTSDDYRVDNAEADGALNSDRINEEDLRAGRWDKASWRAGLVDWTDVAAGLIELGRGELGEIVRTRFAFRTELLTLSARLQNTIGELVTPTCPFVLGSTGSVRACRKDLTAFTFAGVAVTAVTSQREFAASSLAQAAGYFDFGKVTFTTGANAGLSMEVDTHTAGGALLLKLPMPYTVEIGDLMTIVAGCDHTMAACKDKFDNLVNFGGAPYLPGFDAMIQVGRK